jgi:acetyl esterase/lipase
MDHRRDWPDQLRQGPGSSSPRRRWHLPVVLYIHGAGWIFGNAHTHDRLVPELAVGVNAAVVFPQSRPVVPRGPLPGDRANHAVTRWMVSDGAAKDLDAAWLAVTGDSGQHPSQPKRRAKSRARLPASGIRHFASDVSEASFVRTR